MKPLSAAAMGLICCACAGPRSALSPAGAEAERIATLFWWMLAGAGVVWLGVVGLTLFAMKARGEADRSKKANWIIVGGAAAPAGVLAVLLLFGLAMLPDLLAVPPNGTLRVHVTAEQWWWRFRYVAPGKAPFETANELRLPLGEPVEFLLHSHNVIHSFWIPSLGGKVDVIPGRVNRLVLHPTRTGTFLGTCAEYCGTGHSNMAMEAIVVSKDAFQTWADTMRGLGER